MLWWFFKLILLRIISRLWLVQSIPNRDEAPIRKPAYFIFIFQPSFVILSIYCNVFSNFWIVKTFFQSQKWSKILSHCNPLKSLNRQDSWDIPLIFLGFYQPDLETSKPLYDHVVHPDQDLSGIHGPLDPIFREFIYFVVRKSTDREYLTFNEFFQSFLINIRRTFIWVLIFTFICFQIDTD